MIGKKSKQLSNKNCFEQTKNKNNALKSVNTATKLNTLKQLNNRRKTP